MPILGNQVASDLELSKIHENVPIQTSWGKDTFQSKIQDCSISAKDIRTKQLPLLILGKEVELRNNIHSAIQTIVPVVPLIDESFDSDNRVKELITQILWKPTSGGAFLNTNPFLLNVFITWKTLLLPGFSIIMPLLLLILPFFIQQFINPKLEMSDYLINMKAILLKQITVPQFLRPRSETDRIGFFLESLFIGLTLIMFISSLWNQITASLHLRNIWFDMDDRGSALRTLRTTVETIVSEIKKLPLKIQRGMRFVLEKGEQALDNTKHMVGLDNVSTFGRIWNNPEELTCLKEFIGWVDCLVAISSLENICYPIAHGHGKSGFDIRGAYHPSLKDCVPNSMKTDGHSILTGPNRGGKSTFCKTVGLAIVIAQSWGFAWAEKMTFSPFHSICTVLEPVGKLGIASTFESEIEFAKTVLAAKERPMFVMMDEIFHSTNALDGVAASKVFLRQLYKLKGVVSIISTHYIQLATDFKESAQSLQLVTKENADLSLEYTYKVAEGVSDKSSVMEILKERGLLE